MYRCSSTDDPALNVKLSNFNIIPTDLYIFFFFYMVLLTWVKDYRSFISIFPYDSFQKYHNLAYFSTEFTL